MKKNLVPAYILDNFDKGVTSGYFTGSVISADIKGFTSITEELMKHGQAGAEVLSEIINGIFSTAISHIFDHEGWVTSFAGDAFTAVFPGDFGKKAYSSASAIRDFILSKSDVSTTYGNFSISARIGIARGKVKWEIAKGDRQSSYYFFGNVIKEAGEAQTSCRPGGINISGFKEPKLVKPIERGFSLISKTSKKHIPSFIPDSVLDLNTSGEFRNIVSVFLSFKPGDDLTSFVADLSDAALKAGGFLNKIDYGDKGWIALIIFGAPVAVENQANHALNFCDILLAEYPDIRFGVTEGKAFSGFIGGEEANEYTSLGEVVNLSARLSTLEGEYGIITDERVHSDTADRYDFEEISEIVLKGFEGNITAYRISGTKRRKFKEFQGEFIGREDELNSLIGVARNTFEKRSPSLIYVDGPAGIGKSRIVQAIRQSDTAAKARWIFMPSDEVIRDPFNPLLYYLKDKFAYSDEAGIETNLDNFEKAYEGLLSTLCDDDLKDELIRTKSFIAALLNIFYEDSLYDEVDAQGRYENTISALISLIISEGTAGSVIIELDDGHWMDDDSKKFFNELSQGIKDLPILIISECRYTDEGKPFDLGFSLTEVARIDLASLDENSVRKLIEKELEGQIDNLVYDLILKKSEGNPFYIEQISLYLRESEALKIVENAFTLKSGDITFPIDIGSVIIARIDRLESRLRDLIKTASVLGKEFSAKVLTGMLKGQQLDTDLHEIESEAIWSAISEIWYVFKHAMIRDTVYNMQLEKTLKNLHKLAGDTMEAIYSQDLSPHLAALAYHFEKADISDKAAHYLERAASSAQEKYLNQEALNLYSRLLNFLDEEKKIVDIKVESARIHKLIGNYPQGLEDLQEALTISDNIKDYGASTAKIKQEIANLSWHSGDFKLCLTSGEEAYELFTRLKDLRGMRSAIADVGYAHFFLNDYDKEKECFLTQLELAEKIGDPLLKGIALDDLGGVYNEMGDLEKALECHLEYKDISESLNDRNHMKIAYMSLGNAYYALNSFDDSRKYYEMLHEISKEQGDRFRTGFAIMSFGNVDLAAGRYSSAIKHTEKALSMSLFHGKNIGLIYILGIIGKSYMHLGDYKTAEEKFKKALTCAQDLDNHRGIAHASGILGLLYSKMKRYDEAETNLQRCLKIADKYGLGSYEAIYSTELINIFIGAGKVKEAREIFARTKKYVDKLNTLNTSYQFDLIEAKLLDIESKKGEASDCLRIMAEKYTSCDHKAEIYYRLFNLTGSRSDKEAAKDQYQEFSKTSEAILIKQRLKELA
ncbi:tetratricopeptide repeat protein [bacterium]|nr:tetratricopeptide repeat protein [bacterium]